MPQPIRGPVAILGFDRLEKHLLEGVVFLTSYCLSSFVKFGEKSKMSRPMRGREAILAFQSAVKHKIGRGRWVLACYQVKFRSMVSKTKSKMWRVNDGRTGDNAFGPGALKTVTWQEARCQHFYQVCVFRVDRKKTRWSPRSLIGLNIFDFPSGTA